METMPAGFKRLGVFLPTNRTDPFSFRGDDDLGGISLFFNLFSDDLVYGFRDGFGWLGNQLSARFLDVFHTVIDFLENIKEGKNDFIDEQKDQTDDDSRKVTDQPSQKRIFQSEARIENTQNVSGQDDSIKNRIDCCFIYGQKCVTDITFLSHVPYLVVKKYLLW
jgi:hypothetical protein